MKRLLVVLLFLVTLSAVPALAAENDTGNNTTQTPSALSNVPISAVPTSGSELEEPAAITNALLYSLLGIVILLLIVVGSIVVTVIHKHHTGVEATKTLVMEENLEHHIPYSGEGATLVHHPSIDEARTFITLLRAKGYSDAQIRDHFTNHGWNDQEIALAIRHD